MFGWLKFKSASDEPGPEARGACATLVKRALRIGLVDGQAMVLEVFGASINGEPYGDWEFTCRRTRLPNQPPANASINGASPSAQAGVSKGEGSKP